MPHTAPVYGVAEWPAHGVQGAGGLLPQLRAARDACAALQADKAQLTAALAEEQGKVEALETELEQTADAALELWESMQYSDMAAAAAATAGGAQLGEDDECDGASSLGGGEPEEAWGSPMAEESLLGQPMTPPSLPAQAAAAQLGFLAPVSPLGLMGPPMSPLAAQSALVVAGDSFGMMTPVEQRLAALSSKLLVSWGQARSDGHAIDAQRRRCAHIACGSAKIS